MDEKTKKKGSIISLKAIAAADEVGVLQHQNKELYSQVRLLKRKLQRQKKKTKESTEQQRISHLFQSLVLRNWNTLQHDLCNLLQVQVENSDENDLDPPKKKPKISESSSSGIVKVDAFVPLLLKSGKEFLESDVTTPKQNNDEDEEDEEEEKEKKVEFEAVEENMKKRIAFTHKLFTALLEKNKQLSELAITNVDYRTKSRKYQTNAEAYNHRIRLLEKKLQCLENELEDANSEREIAVRRLNGWKSLGGNGKTNEEKETVTADTQVKSESVKQGNEAEIMVKQEGDVDQSNREKELLEDLQAQKKLAEDRLKELQDITNTRVTMAGELEKLQQELSEMKTRASEKPIKSDESVNRNLEEETQRLKRKLERNQFEREEMREKTNAYIKTFKDLESRENGKGFKAIRENKRLQEELRENKLKLEEMRRKYQHAKKNIQIQEDKREKTKKQHNIAEKKSAGLEKSLAALKTKMEKLTKEKRELDESRNKLLEGKFTDEVRKKDFKAKVEKIKELEAQVEALTEGMAEIENAVGEQERKRKKAIREAEKKFQSYEGYINGIKMKTEPLEQKVNELKMRVDKLAKEKMAAIDALEPNKEQIKELQERIKSLETVREKGIKAHNKALRDAESATEKAAMLEIDIKKAIVDLEKERVKCDEMAKRNVKLVSETQKKDHEIKRLKEESSKSKRVMKRAKSQLDAVTSGKGVVGGDAELKLEMYENALHCPINKHLWKDTILMRCYHMHSKKAIWDNYNKRNRKCPTCKLPYTKDDIKPIFLGNLENEEE